MRRVAWLLLVLFGTACADSKPGKPRAQPEKRGQSASTSVHSKTNKKAEALVRKFECNRCHSGIGLKPASQEKDCVGCHRDILFGRFDAAPEVLKKWQGNLKSLPVTPSLQGMGLKFRRTWVQSHLLNPIDVRPALAATMPRLPLKEDEAKVLTAYLVPKEAPDEVFAAEMVSQGGKLFKELACATCHAFGKEEAMVRPAKEKHELSDDAFVLAPDLLYTRERFQSGQLVAWLLNPKAFQSDSLMPNFTLSQKQAQSLAAYIWHKPVKAASKAKVPKRLAVLKRKVRWDEVFTKVFKTVCWHCHSSSDLAQGDGGVGNTGGFGYPAKGLDLSSYASIRSGSFGSDGKRRSIFIKDEQGESLLMRHIMARHKEVSGSGNAKRLGMPLGFPPLSMQKIQLIDSWIEQGRPR